jgi:NAD(P)-dependent dehydrogenase (short-subunit alcohol dehydrogenase family)
VTGGPSADDRRSIFITGGASGIGRATATFFAERGWFVGAYELDVIDKPDFDRAMREFSDATGGRMDLLFNNAGIGGGGWFEDVPYDVAMRILQVNFVGVVNGVYAGIPLLERTPNSLCFSTSSSAALFGMPRAAMYAATKFAVKGLTEALSVELSRFGSRAADVLPALIDTPILEATPDYSSGERPGIAMRKNATSEGAMRLVQPEEVAALVWRAYGSDRVHWYIPEEMAKVEAARAGGVEPLRDQFKKTVLGGA